MNAFEKFEKFYGDKHYTITNRILNLLLNSVDEINYGDEIGTENIKSVISEIDLEGFVTSVKKTGDRKFTIKFDGDGFEGQTSYSLRNDGCWKTNGWYAYFYNTFYTVENGEKTEIKFRKPCGILEY